jgi:hypothetical protein
MHFGKIQKWKKCVRKKIFSPVTSADITGTAPFLPGGKGTGAGRIFQQIYVVHPRFASKNKNKETWKIGLVVLWVTVSVRIM